MISEIILGISRGFTVGIAGLIGFLHVSAGVYFRPVVKFFEPVAVMAYLCCLIIWILSAEINERNIYGLDRPWD
jgi:hypothetical protein